MNFLKSIICIVSLLQPNIFTDVFVNFLFQIIVNISNHMAENTRIVDPESGQVICVGGCLISDTPSNAPRFGAKQFLSHKALPPTVDLRPFMTKVETQGDSYSWLVFRSYFFHFSKKHFTILFYFIF